MPCGLRETDDEERFILRRNETRDEGIRRVDHRHALEIDVRARELRADVVHVVMHAPQDRVGHRFGGIAARRLVPMQLLDPLEIDDRHDADEQIDMARDVDVAARDGAVQPLVEQHIRVLGQLFPFGERAGLCAVARRFLLVMQVLAVLAASGLAVAAEQSFELLEQIGVGSEMAEAVLAAGERLRHFLLHRRTVVAMKAVAFDECGCHSLAAKDLLERAHDRGGAGAR